MAETTPWGGLSSLQAGSPAGLPGLKPTEAEWTLGSQAGLPSLRSARNTCLDEDISVENLLAGRRSGETQESLRRWLQGREAAGR